MLTLGNKLSLNSQPIYKFVNKYSVQFDGATQRIVTDGADAVLQNTTYSFWAKTSTTTRNAVFGHGDYFIGAFFFNFNYDKPIVRIGADKYVFFTDIPQQDDGEWHHWVVYLDSNNITNSKLYCDSVAQPQTGNSNTGVTSPYTESLTIGSDRQVGGYSFEGQIDEFAVYDRELTQAEITRMYNTYYSPNRVANGNFSQIGNEEVTNGDFSQIGSELVTNGDFATDSDWTFAGTNGEVSGGYGVFPDTTNSYIIQSSVVPASVKQYKLQYEVVESNGGGLGLSGGSSAFGAVNLTSSVGTHTKYITSNGTQTNLQFNNQSSFIGKIDNVSVKEVGQDWQLQYTGTGDWSITDKLNFENVNGGSAQLNVFEVGKTYKITVDYVFTSGTRLILPYDGSNFPTGGVITTTGSVNGYTYYYTPNSTTLLIYSDGNGNGSVDNISVKEVGQHWSFSNVGGDNGWRITGTNAICDSNAATANRNIASDFSLVSGKDYKLTIDILQSADNMQVLVGSTTLSATLPTGTNLAYEYIISGADHTGGVLAFYAGTSDLQEIDNVVLQELKHDATNLMLNAGDYQSANPLITSTKSMEFDGTDDYLQLSEPFSHTNHTITGWIKLDVIGAITIIFDARDSADDGLIAYIDGTGRLSYRIGDGSESTIHSSSLDANKWYNFACTYDGTTQIIYINGVDVVNTTVTKSISTTTNVTIGKASYTNALYFDGKITEVGAFNRALTALEVASLYNQGMPTNLLVNRNNYQSGNPTVFNTKQVDFDGTDDYLEIKSTLGSFTGSVSFWVKKVDNGGGQYFFDARADGGVGYIAQFSSANISVSSGTVYVDGIVSPVVDIGEWHHVVVTGISLDIVSKIIIGTRFNITSEYFYGEMSQIGLWNTTLTADEVSSLYNHGLPIDLTTDQAAYESSSNLVGYWRMGSGTLDTYPLIADQTNATLGSELVTNGDFATDSDWTKDSGWSISNNKANFNTTGNASIQQNLSITTGRTYRIQITGEITSGQLKLANASGLGKDQAIGLPLDTYYTHDGGTNDIQIRTIGASVGYLDNVSIKEVNGNPAIMTNQTSSDIENGSPYANIVQNGDFSEGSTDWVISLDWTLGTNKVTFDDTQTNYIAQDSPSIVNGKSYKMQFTVLDCPSTANIQIYNRSHNTIFIANENWSNGTYTRYFTSTVDSSGYAIWGNTNLDTFALTDIIIEEVNTGLQGYWKMGDGTNDEYPVIYDQTNPTLGNELVVCGDFACANPDSAWSRGTGWTISDGVAKYDGSGGGNLDQTMDITNGYNYKVTFTILNSTQGILGVYLSGGFGGNFGNGTHTILIIGGSASSYDLRFVPISSFIGELDNVSVKEISGNPAAMTNMVEGNITNQYPLTKIRNYYRMGDGILDGYPIIQDQTSPNLAHIPTTNLITYSEDFSQWSANDVTLESGYASPDGGNNAWKVTNTGANAHLVGYNGINTNKHKSIYARTVSGTGYVYLLCRTGNASALYNLSENWQRFDMQHIGSDFFYAVDFRSTTDLTEVLIFGAQLEEQSQATAYLKSDGIAAVRKSSTTNLFEYSESFNNTSWVKSSVTIVDNSSQSPNGTNNASLMYPISNGNYRYIHNSTTTSSASIYTISAFVKASGKNVAWFYINSSGDNGLIYFDLNDETIEVVAGSSGTPTGTITPYDNGWYKITFTSGNAFILNSGSGVGVSDAKGNPAVTANNEDGILVWGLQLEAQTQAETYAKTTGLPVTIDLFTENNYGTMTNMSASDIVEDTP